MTTSSRESLFLVKGKNDAGIRSQLAARKVYALMRDFLHLVYKSDAAGNLLYVLIDGRMTQDIKVPWQVGSVNGLTHTHRDIMRAWIMGKAANGAPLLYDQESRQWCLDIEKYPDYHQAVEWLRLHQMTPELYLTLYRNEAQGRRKSRKRRPAPEELRQLAEELSDKDT